MTPIIAAAILVVLAALQNTNQRRYSAMLYAGVTSAHTFLLNDLDGLAYYGSAALADALVIILLLPLAAPCRVVLGVAYVCLASIAANIAGFAMWYLYLPPFVYDTVFVGIYFWAFFILLPRGGAHDMGGRAGTWRTLRVISVVRASDVTRSKTKGSP